MDLSREMLDELSAQLVKKSQDLTQCHIEYSQCDEFLEGAAQLLRDAGFETTLTCYDSKRSKILHHLCRLVGTQTPFMIVAKKPPPVLSIFFKVHNDMSQIAKESF